jgi:hypothetical protein
MNQDFRFNAARIIAADKDAWKEPGRIGLAMRTMQDIADNDDAIPEARIEAENLVKKLRDAQKRPPLMWTPNPRPAFGAVMHIRLKPDALTKSISPRLSFEDAPSAGFAITRHRSFVADHDKQDQGNDRVPLQIGYRAHP